MERGWRPNVEISPSCPRCGSTNTKFCYYNNYSLTQPRYFCKGCRRYWTKGGSLRNVPVGGGCRKNRRGKSSVRPPTHVVLQSKASGYESMPNGQPFRHECLHRGNISSSVESSSTARTPDGLHIDLALVYAKFLNPQPDSGIGFDLPEFPGDFDPSLEFTNNSMPNTALHQSIQLAEENGAFDNCPSDNEHLKYNSELYASHGTSNHGLPLLPGEEAPNQDILWPRSIHTMGNHSTLQLTQQPMLGPETQYDPKLLFDNWSPFSLSSDHLFSGA